VIIGWRQWYGPWARQISQVAEAIRASVASPVKLRRAGLLHARRDFNASIPHGTSQPASRKGRLDNSPPVQERG